MAAAPADFIAPLGELPLDLFGVGDDLAARVTAWLAQVTALVVPVVVPAGAVADGIISHGVYARAYRAAAAYYAKRAQSASLSDQGSMSWGNPAAVYADLAKREQLLFDGALSVVRVSGSPGGSTPTVITAP